MKAAIYTRVSTSGQVQVRIFNDKIEFWNPGKLPAGWTLDTLKEEHTSEPFNPLIFKMFFWVGYVDEIGSGTNKIVDWCGEWELPEPEFGISGSSIFVKFRKDILTEEYLRELGLNERQIKAVLYVKEKGRITNKEYQKIANVKERLATMELNGLVNKKILQKFGTTGRGTYYAALKPQKPQERRTKGAKTTEGNSHA